MKVVIDLTTEEENDDDIIILNTPNSSSNTSPIQILSSPVSSNHSNNRASISNTSSNNRPFITNNRAANTNNRPSVTNRLFTNNRPNNNHNIFRRPTARPMGPFRYLIHPRIEAFRPEGLDEVWTEILSHLRDLETEYDTPTDSNSEHERQNQIERDLEYESLISLQDSLGTVQSGYSKQQISQLPLLYYTPNPEYTEICIEHFVTGEEVYVMPGCLHRYHKACLEEWLGRSKKCPSCTQIVFENLHI